MRKLIVVNAFSINMIHSNVSNTQLMFSRISLDDAKGMISRAPWSSAIGHAETAKVVSVTLGTEVPMNRATVTLRNDSEEETELLVAQYVGPRLPEGATELPAGSTIQWFHVFNI